MLLLVLLLCVLPLVHCLSNHLATIVSTSIVKQFAEYASFEISNEANDVQMPNTSGKSGSISYTFSSFVFNMLLGSEVSWTQSAAEELSITWPHMTFATRFNYHICKHVLSTEQVEICEDGFIQVFTTAHTGIDMTVLVQLDYTGPNLQVIPKSASLGSNFNQLVETYVACTSFICALPPIDIANGVEAGFPGAFDAGVKASMVAAAKNYVFPTVLEFPLYNNVLRVNMRGEWSLIAANGGVVAMALGDFGTNAKFAPISAGSIKIPSTFVHSPPADVNVLIGRESIDSALWALSELGIFNHTVTEADLPANSPFGLYCNDTVLARIAPGLTKKCGNEAIELAIWPATPPTLLNPTYNATFDIAFFTAKAKTTLFVLRSSVAFAATVDAAVHNATSVRVTAKVTNWQPFVSSVLFTAVGALDTSTLDTAIYLYLQLFGPQPTPFDLSLPATLHNLQAVSLETSAPTTSSEAFYALLIKPPPSPAVPAQKCGSLLCALKNTCCNTYCCMVEKATCCGGGCCPSGTVCCNGNQCCAQNNKAVGPMQ